MKKNLFFTMLLCASFINAQEISIDTSVTSTEENTIQEYWYWADGVTIVGTNFSPNSEITITSEDPEGNVWRKFTGTSTSTGTFEIKINAMKNRSIIGTHTVLAKDDSGNSATAKFQVKKNPNEVLEVVANPKEITTNDLFYGAGVDITIKNLTPNGLVKVNLGSPDASGMEVEPTKTKYANANGEYTFKVDGNLEVGTIAAVYQLPNINGVWGVSAFDFSQSNNNTGYTNFRLSPNNPTTSNYCQISNLSNIYPITYVELNDMTNKSDSNSLYYENFTSKTANLEKNKTYKIKIQGQNMNSWTVDTYTAFIDWNQNGILDEDGEILSLGFVLNSTGSDDKFLEGEITVPEGAKPGKTRMRLLKVRSISSTALFWPSGSCGSYSDGQVEDYSLNITQEDLSIEEQIKDKSKVYPNPVKDILNIDNTDVIEEYKIIDLTGKIILTNTNNSKKLQINIGKLNPGVYILNLLVNNKIETHKIIKK